MNMFRFVASPILKAPTDCKDGATLDLWLLGYGISPHLVFREDQLEEWGCWDESLFLFEKDVVGGGGGGGGS